MELNKENQVCQKISSEIKNKFHEIYEVLKERENQILKQVEVIVQHYNLNNSYDKIFDKRQITVNFENENELMQLISKFGKINFQGNQENNLINKLENQSPKIEEPKEENTSRSTENSKRQIENPNITMKNINCSVENLNTSSKSLTQHEISNVILECIEKQDPSLCRYNKKLCCTPNSNSGSNIKKFCDTINSFEENSIFPVEQGSNLVTQSSEQVQTWIQSIIREPEIEPHPPLMEYSQIKP